MSAMRVLIAAGGTGGHIYPGLPVATKCFGAIQDRDQVEHGAG